MGNMFKPTRQSTSCFCQALHTTNQIFQKVGGRILIFQANPNLIEEVEFQPKSASGKEKFAQNLVGTNSTYF